MLSNSDMFLIVLFSIVIIIYEMLTRGVLTIEMLQSVFSGNAIIYIIFAVVIIFLRKYLSLASAKSQVTKLEKSILTLNNKIQKMKEEAEWDHVLQSNKYSALPGKGKEMLTFLLPIIRYVSILF